MRRPVGLMFVNRFVNPLVRAALRSPLHRLASGQLLVIELVGVRSGRTLSLPVGYQQTGASDFRVHVGASEHKLWWRNLREPRQVKLWVRGVQITATGQALEDQASVDVVLHLDGT